MKINGVSDYRCATCSNVKCEFYKIKDQSRGMSDRDGDIMSPSIVTASVGCLSHVSFSDSETSGWDKALQRVFTDMGNKLDCKILEKQSQSMLEKVSPFNKGYRKALYDVADLINSLRSRG